MIARFQLLSYSFRPSFGADLQKNPRILYAGINYTVPFRISIFLTFILAQKNQVSTAGFSQAVGVVLRENKTFLLQNL